MLPKYRAWLVHDEIMFDLKGFQLIDNITIELYTTTNGTLWFPIENIVLMQNSGLEGLANIELYDGDIIRFTKGNDDLYKVVQVAGGFIAINIKDVADQEIMLKYDNFYDFEIIGNIYENPELLEEE